MTIVVIMLALLAPAIRSTMMTAGRKGAVNVLMNTIEQARAAALESATNVYVVFWQREFPEQDSIMVVRAPVEWNANEAGQTLIPLTRWIPLPKGVLLLTGKGRNLFQSGKPASFNVEDLPKKPALGDLGFLQFSPSGGIQHPADKNDCRLIVSEGVRGANKTVALFTPKKEQGLFDIITFRRSTGRTSLDVTTLQ